MLDVRLITLLPPTQPVGQPPATPGITQPSAPPAVTTQQGASILAQLPNGSLLSGFIINRDASGNPILRTDKGDVLFSSNFFLKIGSEVVIRVQNNGGQQNAHLVTVNGLPPEVAEGQSSFADDGEIIVNRQQPAPQQQQAAASNAQRSAAPSQPANFQPGQTISAIVVTPSVADDGQPLQPGTSLLLNVLPKDAPQRAGQSNAALAQLTPSSVSASTGTSSNALSSLLPDTKSALLTQPTAQPATIPSTVNSPLSQILATPAQQLPPQLQPSTPNTAPLNLDTPQENTSSLIGQTAPYTASNQQAAGAKFSGPLGQVLIATALVQGDDGSVLFDSPIGTLRVANVGSVPQGQQLTLRVSSVANPNNYTVAVANQAPAAPLAPLSQLSRTWPSLAHIASILGEETASQIIPNFTASALISPDAPGRAAQAGSQIMFFIAALKGGSFRDWLGAPQVRALEEKGYSSLLKKAEGEFLQMARQFADVQQGNWQSAYFPVIASGELTQVRAFIKREKKKDEQGKATGDEDTRFVIEMDLSQMGEIQMDGLVKRRDQNMQFDLVIRSLQLIPLNMQHDIQEIYTSTAQLTGYHGQLAFQFVPAFPIRPLEETLPHEMGDIII